MSVGRPIPVLPGEPHPGGESDFADSPPIAMVHLASDQNWTPESKHHPHHNRVIYRALIDTGASGEAIDHQVAADIGAELGGSGIAQGFAGRHEHLQQARIQVVFPCANVVYSTYAGAVSSQSSGFDLVLGRLVLRHCQFLVDGRNGSYHLSWIR